MRSLLQLFVFSGIVSMALLLTGMYRPWVVLWWRPRQNRRKVLQLYGSLLAVSATGYLVIALLTR